MGKRAFIAATLIVACTESTPVAPDLRAPSASISDAVHESGNRHFYFLPPLVPDPTPTGEFDGSLTPVVQVCEWVGVACGPVIAEFTMTSGTGSQVVRVVPEEEHYIVNWHTDQFGLDPAKTYRIRVIVDGAELGHADVDVVESGREVRNVETGAFVPLVDGTTLPISFRIEEGALGIVIDATALTAPEFRVTGLEGGFPTDERLAVALAPGAHTIFYQTAGGCTPLTGPCVAYAEADFTIVSDGTLDFDPSLDGILAGRGTTSLTVNGITLDVDLRALSAPTVGIGGLVGPLGGGQGFTTDRVYTLTLLPGLHPIYYQTQGGCTPLTGPCVAFTDAFFLATVGGAVDYDASLDGIFAGRGMTTLTVDGADITIDATGLDETSFHLGGVGDFATGIVQNLKLLPGSHRFSTIGGDEDFFFGVLVNETLGFDTSLDSFVSGRGSATLKIVEY